jgi:hypothetical protein
MPEDMGSTTNGRPFTLKTEEQLELLLAALATIGFPNHGGCQHVASMRSR